MDNRQGTPSTLFEIYHENSKLREYDYSLYSWIGYINDSDHIRNIISKPNYSYKGFKSFKLLPVKKSKTSSNSFENVIFRRRSTRSFSQESVTIKELSRLLFWGNGVTDSITFEDGSHWKLRTAPSGGGLFPIEIFCLVLNVQDLSSGIYLFNPVEGSLVQIKEIEKEVFLKSLVECMPALADTLNDSAVILTLASFMPRISFKYKERAYRFALIEVGHIAQNLVLGCEAEKLSSLCIGGFVDDRINNLIGADGINRMVQYCVAIGKKKNDHNEDKK